MTVNWVHEGGKPFKANYTTSHTGDSHVISSQCVPNEDFVWQRVHVTSVYRWLRNYINNWHFANEVYSVSPES